MNDNIPMLIFFVGLVIAIIGLFGTSMSFLVGDMFPILFIGLGLGGILLMQTALHID